MKTLVYVYSFFEIKHFLYIIEIELYKKIIVYGQIKFGVDNKNIIVAMVTGGKLYLIMP